MKQQTTENPQAHATGRAVVEPSPPPVDVVGTPHHSLDKTLHLPRNTTPHLKDTLGSARERT